MQFFHESSQGPKLFDFDPNAHEISAQQVDLDPSHQAGPVPARLGAHWQIPEGVYIEVHIYGIDDRSGDRVPRPHLRPPRIVYTVDMRFHVSFDPEVASEKTLGVSVKAGLYRWSAAPFTEVNPGVTSGRAAAPLSDSLYVPGVGTLTVATVSHTTQAPYCPAALTEKATEHYDAPAFGPVEPNSDVVAQARRLQAAQTEAATWGPMPVSPSWCNAAKNELTWRAQELRRYGLDKPHARDVLHGSAQDLDVEAVEDAVDAAWEAGWTDPDSEGRRLDKSAQALAEKTARQRMARADADRYDTTPTPVSLSDHALAVVTLEPFAEKLRWLEGPMGPVYSELLPGMYAFRMPKLMRGLGWKEQEIGRGVRLLASSSLVDLSPRDLRAAQTTAPWHLLDTIRIVRDATVNKAPVNPRFDLSDAEGRARAEAFAVEMTECETEIFRPNEYRDHSVWTQRMIADRALRGFQISPALFLEMWKGLLDKRFSKHGDATGAKEPGFRWLPLGFASPMQEQVEQSLTGKHSLVGADESLFSGSEDGAPGGSKVEALMTRGTSDPWLAPLRSFVDANPAKRAFRTEEVHAALAASGAGPSGGVYNNSKARRLLDCMAELGWEKGPATFSVCGHCDDPAPCRNCPPATPVATKTTRCFVKVGV